MATPRQLTQIAFAAPLDESTEDEVLDPSVGFPVLQNVRQDKRGGISKRLGFSALSADRIDATARSEGHRLFAHQGKPCIIGGRTLDVYSEDLGSNVDCGSVPDCSVNVVPLPASVSNGAVTQHDSVVVNGFLILVYSAATSEEALGANVLVSTLEDNIPIRHDRKLFGTSDPIFQVGGYGTSALLVSGSTSSATLQLWTLDCTDAGTVSAGWTLYGNIAVNKKTSTSNLTLQSLNSSVAVGYINGGAGVAQFSVATLTTSGVATTTSISTTAVTPDNVALAGTNGDRLWASWNEGTDVKVCGLDPSTLAVTSTAGTVFTGGLMTTNPPSLVSSTTPGAGYILAYAGDGTVRRADWTTTAGAVVVGTSGENRGATVQGRAFSHGDRLLGLFYVDAVGATDRGTLMLADWSLANGNTFPPLAMAKPNLASADATAHVMSLGSSRYAYVTAVMSAASVKTYALVVCDFANRFRWRHDFHNGCTYLSGGILSYFSNDVVQEASFLHAPRNIDVTPDAGGTGPTGTVNYVVVFEAVDGAGNLSVSGVSAPYEYTGTGVQVFPTCDPLLVTSRPVAHATLYRTEASGKTYYKIETRNCVDGETVDFVDSYDDATLILQPRLYGTGVLPGTFGSALQREAPPYCADVVSYAGMVVVASGSDLWWSGQTIGGEGAWFSTEQFFLTVEGEGDITALAVHDGTLFIFKEDGIWIANGEAPSDNGAAGGLGTPRRIAGDVGCIEPSSVVVTSLGVFFRSHRGIELMGRGGPVWIGEKVQRTLAAYPYVTSATRDMHNNLVRFSLAKSMTSGVVDAYVYDEPDAEDPVAHEYGGGRDLVFDPVINDWQSVDDKTGTTAHQASQDACTVSYGGKRRYAWLSSSGVVYVESDSYDDVGYWIEMAAETGWFKLSGIQGRQFFNRLLLMARKRAAANISVSIGYNYSTEYAASRTWTSDDIDGLLTDGWPITQLKHDSNDNGEGQSVRVRVVDDGNGVVEGGRGHTWLALSLDITPQDGLAEVPEEAS